MEYVFESLNEYKDFNFFRLLEEMWAEKEEKKSVEKDPKKELEVKQQTEDAKYAQMIIKKVKDNFARFKSYAGNEIELYKAFWNIQMLAKKEIKSKEPSCEIAYSMFTSNVKTKPNYVVCLKGRTSLEKASIVILKTKLEEGEENPIYKVSDNQAIKDFSMFWKELQSEMMKVKEDYVKNVEIKKKEEEERKRKERLDKFLKESKKSK